VAPLRSVDVNWAKEHHRLWYQEELRKGDVRDAARPVATPAE
jgi:hypothetical protein